MTLFRSLIVLGLAACLAPLASVMLAGTLASMHGCTLHEGFANPCFILGADRGQTLYAMGVSGWLMLLTLPVGVGLIGLWLAVEIGRFVRRRRARRGP